MTNPEEFHLSELAGPPTHRRWRPLLLGGLLLVALAGTGGWWLLRPAGTIPGPTAQTQTITLCQNEVLRQLKAPATARFSGPNTYYESTDGHRHVEGAVDAQNSFGASIRDTFTCDTLFIDGHWVPGVTINDGP